MNNTRFYLFFLFSFIFHNGISCDGVAFGDSVNKEQQDFAATEQKLERFNRHLSWLVGYFSQYLAEKEEHLKKNGAWEKEVANNNKIKQEIARTQKKFLDFRQNITDLIHLINGPAPQTRTMSTYAYIGLTDWYIDCLENDLFPQGWEVFYDEYIQKQNTAEELGVKRELQNSRAH